MALGCTLKRTTIWFVAFLNCQTRKLRHFVNFAFRRSLQMVLLTYWLTRKLTSCVGGHHNMSPPLQVDLWPYPWFDSRFDSNGNFRFASPYGQRQGASGKQEVRVERDNIYLDRRRWRHFTDRHWPTCNAVQGTSTFVMIVESTVSSPVIDALQMSRWWWWWWQPIAHVFVLLIAFEVHARR